MVPLRPFQRALEQAVYTAWAPAARRNVMPVAATGSGKTVVLSKFILDNDGASCTIAHRQELVSQISLALARNGVRHRVIGQPALSHMCKQVHIGELGYHFIDPNARAGVAGVDTLVRIKPDDPDYRDWFRSVTLMTQDEAHHVLKDNKWGKAAELFPNARGLLPTATPKRADGKGLGRHADGLVDEMVLAPGMRDIINMGYLTDYRVWCPPSDLNLDGVEVGASGEFIQEKLRTAVHQSHITGDIVRHYLALARGKLGVTFAVDIEAATEIAAAYRAAGVPAEVVTSKTPGPLRAEILRRFKRREILNLVNVDLFGEGFDLPAIEVVSMGRPTQSFALYTQQYGRALRLMIDPSWFEQVLGVTRYDSLTDAERREVIARSSKPYAIIIDHVGNVVRHKGPPDRFMDWSLDRADKRSGGSGALLYKACTGCSQPYESYLKACPYCGASPPIPDRSAPEFVDGDLIELDAAVLAAMRGEIARVDGAPPVAPGAEGPVAGAIRRNHWERQQAQAALRQAMLWFGAFEGASRGVSIDEQRKLFFERFGLDVGTAQTLGARDAEALRQRVAAHLGKCGIDAAVAI